MAAPFLAPVVHPHADDSAPEESPSDPKRVPQEGKSHSERATEDTTSIEAILVPGLYIAATPIGNAADITLRALNVLKHCDAIVAEDTRVTSRLLAIHGISRPLLVYNDHNAASMRPKLLERLRSAARLALVSDAGTPLVSDPGHKLVREALRQGLPVFPIPGPSAVLAGLVSAGLPTDRFFFGGFLPAKPGERRRRLEDFKSISATLIFFESAQRLGDALAEMADVLGPRDVAVARELTKLHEEVRRGTLRELAAHYAAVPARGEIVLLVGPPLEHESPDSVRIDALLTQALAFMPVKAAVSLIAEATGVGRRAIYGRALALKDIKEGDDGPEA